MFLSTFNEKQKILFLQLAEYAINVDHKIEEIEKKLLEEYCKEMGILNEKKYDSNLNLKFLTDSINKEFSEIEKKKIFLETLFIVMCDNDFCEEEKKFILELGESLQFKKTDIMDACDLVSGMQDTYFRLQTYFYG